MIKHYFIVRSDQFDSEAACASLCSYFNDGLYFIKAPSFTVIILKSVEPLLPSASFRIQIQTSGAISVTLDTQSSNLWFVWYDFTLLLVLQATLLLRQAGSSGQKRHLSSQIERRWQKSTEEHQSVVQQFGESGKQNLLTRVGELWS